MKKLIMFLCGTLIATSVLGATVSNTAAWNVPWGDAWRSRAEATLDAFVSQININTAGTAVPLASNTVFIGSAAGVATAKTISGDISLANTGAMTVDEINSIAVATVTAGAALGDTSLQDTDVWGAPGLTPTTNSTSEIEVAIQMKTIAGGNLAERRFIRVYCSDTSGGVAADTSMASFVLTTGTAVETFVANADYSYVTAVAGTALLTITSSAPDDKWVTVIDGSSTTEIALTFTGP